MIRSILAPCAGLALLIGAICSTIADDDPPATPDAVLKAKGLKRSGETFVLGTEVEVQKATSAARAASRAVAIIVEQKRQLDQNVRDGNAFVRDLVQQRIILNRQLAQAGSAQENNRIVAMLNELTDRITLTQKELGDPDAGKAAGAGSRSSARHTSRRYSSSARSSTRSRTSTPRSPRTTKSRTPSPRSTKAGSGRCGSGPRPRS